MGETSSTAARAPGAIRIAFVMHVMHVAGAEVLVAETIRALGNRLDPVIFCLDAIGPLGEALQSQRVPVVTFARRPGHDWRVAWQMARELRRRRIQVIHAHQYTPFFYSALARVLAGGRPRLIFTEHGRHYPDVVRPARRGVNRWLLSRLATEANAVCAFSARALREVDGFSNVRVGVIENGIHVDRYAGHRDSTVAKRHLGVPVDRRYVVNVARQHPVKDQATLIDGFRLVASAHPDVDLLLAGDGPLRADLEQHVRRLQLGDRVRFLGVRDDVPHVLAAAEVFCLTSVSEAASLTLLEAMASGLPVVITDVGGNPEIVRDGVEGLLVPRGDAAAVGRALLQILDDRALAARLGGAGAERVRQLYRLDRTIARYYELYQHTAGRVAVAPEHLPA
jgi:glycosyltransferase involved in cell wall biosynthesis